MGTTSNITSSAGYAINLGFSSPATALDDGCFNQFRISSTGTLSGASGDINLGDSTTSLAALRALAGKVAIGPTTLNRAISY
jgi:hypothetical protein